MIIKMRYLLKIGLPVIFCFIQYGTYAQQDGKLAPRKRYVKFIRLIDADTKKPVPDYFYTIVTFRTPEYSGKTNAEGYGYMSIAERLYDKTVEINLNDGTYFNPKWVEWKDKINTIPYKLINKNITFPSKKEKIDTITVELKRLPDGTPTLITRKYADDK